MRDTGRVPSFSVVMPTRDRPEQLRRAIASVVDQLEDGDELIVVGDGEQDVSAGTVGDFQPANVFYVETQRPGSVFGNWQRTWGMELAAGRSDFLCFLDDDDAWTDDALDHMRYCIGDDLTHAHIFKATWGPGHHAHGYEAWKEPVVREQNIATPMVVLPNRPYSIDWMTHNDRGIYSDYGFLSAAIGECDGVRWHESCIAIVRP